MSRAGFYSGQQQILREWRILWRVHRRDTLLGGVYVLLGFYIFHDVGNSKVYDVIPPFTIACLVLWQLTSFIASPHNQKRTASYYAGLPHDRIIAWDARLLYLLAVVVYLEAVIMFGVIFKLGGAGVTPIYRLHPEAFAAPFLVMSCVLLHHSVRHRKRYNVVSTFAVIIGAAAVTFWWKIKIKNHPGIYNQFTPQYRFTLELQFTFALILMILAIATIVLIRYHWQRREAGVLQ